MTDLSVKYFHSSMAGAPQMSNNWGDLVGLLDACLVNGFGLQALTSLSWSEGLATAQASSGHGFRVDQVITLAGADQAEFNGSFRVVASTAISVSVAMERPSVLAATTRSTLTARVTPLGWDKPCAAQHKAAYRSKNPLSPQNLLLIDNSLKTPDYNPAWAKWANVGIVQDLADIDTPVGAQAPFDPNSPLQNWRQTTPNQWGWHKWYHARQGGYETSGDSGGGNRNWVLIGDDRLFYLFCTSAAGYNWYGRSFYCFGDIQSFKPADRYATVLCADDLFWSTNSQSVSYPGQYSGYGLVSSLDFTGKLLLRNHTQVGNPVRFGISSLNLNNGQVISGRGPMPFPNGPDYSLWMLPAYVRQDDGHMRGMMPGMSWLPQDRPYSDLTIVQNLVNQPDRKVLLVRTQYSNEVEGAQMGFDITGPWR